MANIDEMKASMSPEELEAYNNERAAVMQGSEEGFAKIDTNSDGILDRDELRSLAKQGLPNQSSEQIEASCNKYFAMWDANHDGKVSKEEWLQFYGDMFDNVYMASH